MKIEPRSNERNSNKHDATEALVSTIEEQHIDLLFTEFDTFRTNKALKALITCNIIAVLTGGSSDDEIMFETSQETQTRKKTMLVVYDGGDHADMVLRAASWLEHSGKFNVIVMYINRKYEQPNEDKVPKEEYKPAQYNEQIGVKFTEVKISECMENSPEKYAQLISSSINASDPDLVVTGLTIGKFSVLENQFFAAMLDRFNCPAIVARAFVIPGVSRIRGIIVSLLHRVLDRVKGYTE